ncbi:MAG: glutamine amidotransferase, partial [Eubacteriaceae bacterium]
MLTIYVYVLDTMADWELGYVTAELNSGRFFRKEAPEVSLKTVSCSKEVIKT